MMFSKSRSDIVGSAVKTKDEKDSSILNSQHTAGVYRCGWNIDKNRKRHWSMWCHASNVTSLKLCQQIGSRSIEAGTGDEIEAFSGRIR